MGQTEPLTPVDFYRAERDGADAETGRAKREARTASRVRLLLIAIVFASAIAAFWIRPELAWVASGVAALAFAAAVRWHRRVNDRWADSASRSRAATEGIARIERSWDELPPFASPAGLGIWPSRLAADLGIVGDRSLMQLLAAPRSQLGARRLLGWLLDDPEPIDVIRARQRSVWALRPRSAFLLRVAAQCERAGERAQTARAIPAFVAWCEMAASARRSSRFLSIAFIVIGLAGVLWRTNLGNILITLAIAGQTGLAMAARRRISENMKGLDAAVPQLDGLARVTALFIGEKDVDGAFGELQSRLREAGVLESLATMVRLLSWNEVRYSPLGHWALNLVVGFDVHLEAALEKARARNSVFVRAWIDDVANGLALLSLATMAFEHPDWTVPTFDEGAASVPLVASSLAHPLLGASAIANDVNVSPPNLTIVVSGPNMAGKTTYLRAVGVNHLLAHAGGVVRAKDMRLCRARVRSSIRIEDDLGHGISLFLAEILRTRDIVVAADDRDAPRVMFLFDEILHGTNAEDRRLATRAVLARLAAAGASGIVTTHDPQIAPPGSAHLHFDADIGRDASGRPTLEFDYRAVPGPATRANALALVELYLGG